MSETKETEKKHDPKKPMFYQITQDNKRVTLDQMQDNSLDNPLWDDFDEVVISTKYILDTLIQY